MLCWQLWLPVRLAHRSRLAAPVLAVENRVLGFADIDPAAGRSAEDSHQMIATKRYLKYTLNN